MRADTGGRTVNFRRISYKAVIASSCCWALTFMSSSVRVPCVRGLSAFPSSPRQHKITWIVPKNDGQSSEEDVKLTFTVNHNENLRTASLQAGIASPHNGKANWINCRGLGTCGTCAVEIKVNNNLQEDSGSDLPPRNSVEQARLALPPHRKESNLRLACQTRVQCDLVVRKYGGFWGEDTDRLVKPTRPTAPLGELEYLLDRNK